MTTASPFSRSIAAELVDFTSASFAIPPSPFKIRQAKKQGKEIVPKMVDPVPLQGSIDIPKGDGPFPAIVLLHGCAGISKWNELWTKRLLAWGYVVLNVDSFTPRGLSYVCYGEEGAATPWNRSLDAYGAKSFLSTQQFVDADRIAVIGMSHGGAAVLHAVERSASTGVNMEPFTVAIALYPLCRVLKQIATPTMIFIGEEDEWTPAEWCVRYVDELEKPHDVVLKVFPGVHHVYDVPGIDGEAHGLELRYDAAADAETIESTRRLLKEFMH